MSKSENRRHDALTSIVDDAAECGSRLLEYLTDSEILKLVPAVNVGVAVLRSVSAFRDRALAKRIETFFYALREGLEPWEVKDTLSRLEANKHYAESVGEYLVERLERLDGRRKALMTAAAFNQLGKRKIDEDTFYRLQRAIEVVHLMDLATLRNLLEEGPYQTGPHHTGRKFTPHQESLQSLDAASLAFFRSLSPIGSNPVAWELTNLGRKFLELRLDLIEFNEALQFRP